MLMKTAMEVIEKKMQRKVCLEQPPLLICPSLLQAPCLPFQLAVCPQPPLVPLLHQMQDDQSLAGLTQLGRVFLFQWFQFSVHCF